MKSFRPAFLLFALPAVLLFVAPAARESFAFDRTALLHGEWWRLWTGHWVHFSASHLFWNLLVLAVAGRWLESLRPGSLWRYTPVAAPLLSLALFAWEPVMQTYGGLSGLATGAVVLLALEQISRREPGWWGVLALVLVKIAWEIAHGITLFSSFSTDAIRPSAVAHAAGAGAALAFFLSRRATACLPLRDPAPVRVATPDQSPR